MDLLQSRHVRCTTHGLLLLIIKVGWYRDDLPQCGTWVLRPTTISKMP